MANIMRVNLENSAVVTELEKVTFHSNSKERHLLPRARQYLNHHAQLTNEKGEAQGRLSNLLQVKVTVSHKAGSSSPLPLSFTLFPAGSVSFKAADLI